jgi:short-subunit dehydrogenase
MSPERSAPARMENRPNTAYADKVILVTGASSGLGRGTALHLAPHGAKLVLAARRTCVLEELARECRAGGGEALPVTVDIGLEEDVEPLKQATLQSFGRIDVWINNAGVGALGTFTDVPMADHLRALQTNVHGTFFGSYVALKQFHAQGSGILINGASMLGRISSPYYAAYNASKHAIIGLTQTLRHEIDEQKIKDIHVCLVLPMAMSTPFFDHAANYSGRKAVPIPPVADVQKGIDAIADLIARPKSDVIVGPGGGLSQFAYQVLPATLENMTSDMVQFTQMQAKEAQVPKTGNLYEPANSGAGVASDHNN